jgi:hypothetical protein
MVRRSAGGSSKQYAVLKISRQVLRQLDGIQLVRIKREQRKQNLGFSSRPFVLCGLPIRRPPAGQLIFERRNGQFVLQVTGHPDYGLPFGQDRIVPIFLATLAVRQQSQTISFRNRRRNAGNLRNAEGRKAVSTTGSRL